MWETCHIWNLQRLLTRWKMTVTIISSATSSRPAKRKPLQVRSSVCVIKMLRNTRLMEVCRWESETGCLRSLLNYYSTKLWDVGVRCGRMWGFSFLKDLCRKYSLYFHTGQNKVPVQLLPFPQTWFLSVQYRHQLQELQVFNLEWDQPPWTSSLSKSSAPPKLSAMYLWAGTLCESACESFRSHNLFLRGT